jgi:hypothetical protein
VSLFPKARPSRATKRQVKRGIVPHPYVESGQSDYRRIGICGRDDCGNLATHPVHDIPPVPDDAAEIDARRLGEA